MHIKRYFYSLGANKTEVRQRYSRFESCGEIRFCGNVEGNFMEECPLEESKSGWINSRDLYSRAVHGLADFDQDDYSEFQQSNHCVLLRSNLSLVLHDHPPAFLFSKLFNDLSNAGVTVKLDYKRPLSILLNLIGVFLV